MKVFAAIVTALLAACVHPAPGPAPIPDASDAAPAPANDPATAACAHLRELGCPLGNDPNCAPTFRLPGKFGADPSCVSRAAAKSDLAACNVTCQE